VNGTGIVNSYNEWDRLKEVIVGIVDDACLSSWSVINKRSVPEGSWDEVRKRMIGDDGYRVSDELIDAGKQALENLVNILKSEGVTVRRPDQVSFSRPFSTPDWSVDCGFSAANPRDIFMVVGDQIIETPVADRGRYFEFIAYRGLLNEYFEKGAKWVSAPKPRLADEMYRGRLEGHLEKVLNNLEPTFDAADFVRCGNVIFGQLSHVTNQKGVDWLRSYLGPDFQVCLLKSRDPCAIHIDTTFMPLCPGKVLVNPEYLDVSTLPDILKNWEVLVCPKPHISKDKEYGMLSPWISMNILMLDQNRVIVEKDQKALIQSLKEWGFDPVPIDFSGYYPFAGALHCATLDIHREGTLQSYF
jgi:glycine amidinotransferase